MPTTQSHLCCNPECPNIADLEKQKNYISCSRCRKAIHCSILCQACSSDVPLGVHTESSTSTEEPFVLLLSLSSPDILASICGHVVSALRSKVRIIQALNARTALQYLADTNLEGVFVADEGIIESENSEVLSSLIGWVHAGGIAVFGSIFASFVSWKEFDGFFRKWGLPWTLGNYTGSTFILNPSIRQLSSHSANLATSYSMKALHLRGVKAEDILYAPMVEIDDDEESDGQFHVFPPSALDLSNVPVAYTRIGDGFLGYVGDVNAEDESTSVILAMLCL